MTTKKYFLQYIERNIIKELTENSVFYAYLKSNITINANNARWPRRSLDKDK